MDDVKKYVDFSYMVGWIILMWVTMRITDLLFVTITALPNPEVLGDIQLSSVIGFVLASGVAIYLRLNQNIYKSMNECGVELKKTIWPGWEETKSNTVVVIVVTVIMGVVLWGFDLLWRGLTKIIY